MTNVSVSSPVSNVVVSGDTVTVATVGTQGPAGGTGIGIPTDNNVDGALITFSGSAGNYVAVTEINNAATTISGGHF